MTAQNPATDFDRPTIEDLINREPIGWPAIRLIVMCSFLMACDAYDLSSVAFVAPSLMRTWQIDHVAMGLVISSALAGMLVGALVLGDLGDRFGRRRMILWSTYTFAVFTILAGFAQSPTQLAVLRFLAALGLAGITPNIIALASEMVPVRQRATAIGIIFAGFLFGGILAGLVAAFSIPIYGWESVFFVGGVLSLAVGLVAQIVLPESLVHLASRAERQVELNLAIARHWPQIDPDSVTARGRTGEAERLGVRALFAPGLRGRTAFLWLIYFACALAMFLIGSWLPVMVERHGFDARAGAIATATMFAGGALGSVVGGIATDRIGFNAIALMGILSAITIALIGQADGRFALLIAAFVAGIFLFGSQSSLHGIVGSAYPARIRATGAGWASGISKTGAMLGPIIGGTLLARLDVEEIFVVAGTPMIVTALSALALAASMKASQPAVSPTRNAPDDTTRSGIGLR